MNRREFLTGTFLGLLIKPQSDSNSPKFKMGDYVEHTWVNEVEENLTYRGYIIAVCKGSESCLIRVC